LRRIADAACADKESLVIEIGPGKGTLTRFLAKRAERLIAIELDAELAAALPAHVPGVEVAQGDVLSVDLGQWGPAVIAGNLPYYITSPILDKTLALGALVKRAVFLVQREVAERLVAKPASRDYGYLTVKVQALSRVEYLFRVAPGSFQPPPKVESAVVRLTPAPPPVADVQGFLRFVGQCFKHKRKTLKNNLGTPAHGWPEAQLRAEQLTVEQFAGLFQRLH
jgi:16S rRNA (adenine1518-N6/adenine1519-N6)-dimethyltransferase